MRHWILMAIIMIASSSAYGQTCPTELTFYKTTAGNNQLCVKFIGDPGVNNITQGGFALTRQGTTNNFATPNGSCTGNAPPTSPVSFNIGGLTCSYTANGTLPVEFASFSYSLGKNATILAWSTASEINNDFFSIERKSISGQFEEVGRVDGNGSSSITNSYTFNDRIPLYGLQFYRIKQVDYDGRNSYSKIISVTSESGTHITQRADFLDVSYNDQATLAVYDVTGRLIKKISFYDHFSLDLKALEIKGMYLAILTVSGQEIDRVLISI